MSSRSRFLILLPLILLPGCSPKGEKIGLMDSVSNGVKVELTSNPDPPIAGSDLFTVRLTDDTTGAPVVNANVTISAYNDLAGGGDRESGRSQGDGSYNVPIKLGIADQYRLNVSVQRPGHDDSDTTFTIVAG